MPISTTLFTFSPIFVEALQRLTSNQSEISLLYAPSTSALFSFSSELSPDERRDWETLCTKNAHKKRKATWLLGRLALKKVLHALQENPDTNQINFPSARFSVSHSTQNSHLDCSTAALAIGINPTDTVQINGVGADIQLYERTDSIQLLGTGIPTFSVLSRVCSKPEWDWLQQQSVDTFTQNALLLWTVKEACYKATPHEAQSVVSSFAINMDNLSTTSLGNGSSLYQGTAVCKTNPQLSYRWVSAPLTIQEAETPFSAWASVCIQHP